MDARSRVVAQLDRAAARPFLIDDRTGETVTYADLRAGADDDVAALQSLGVGEGDRVAILLDTSVRFVRLYFACLLSGAVAVPVNKGLHPTQLDAVLGIARPRVLVSENEPPRIVEATARPTPSGVATIHFTSGTTSVPKGVAHSTDRLLDAASAFAAALGFTEDDRMLHLFPMSYMAGFLNTVLCPFVTGGSVVLTGGFDARTAMSFWAPVRRHGVTTLWTNPTMLASLLRLDRDPDVPAWVAERRPTVCVGTAPLPRRTAEDFATKYGVEVHESYGLSELLFVATNDPATTRHDGVGTLLPGVEARIGEPGAGVDGEISVRTPYAMLGYVDGEDPTRLVPSAEWFTTGDLGALDGSYLTITGRSKDLIIRGGLNVSPTAIEDVVHRWAAVDQVAVVGVPHEFYGEVPVAVITVAEGVDTDGVERVVSAHCRNLLPAEMVPARVVVVDALPLNASGKVQKAALVDALAVP